MGLLNKLKNVLFEEEEIEVPVEEPKVKKEPIVEEKKVERKKNVYDEYDTGPLLSDDKNLFKAEKTFDFPMFDDKEFEDMKQTTFEEKPKIEEKKSSGINLFDYEKPKIKKEKRSEEIKGRAYNTKSSELDTKKFRPSPVISPVYGVLDKNYKKEDIIVKKEEKKSFDVDDVRKKAFGTLEDDIEKTLMETRQLNVIKEKEENKSIDELLEETSFDTIDLDENSIQSPKMDEELFNDEEELVIQNDPELEEKLKLDVFDNNKEEKKTEKEKIEDDDTLENDLYHLIDSMYENKEEE